MQITINKQTRIREVKEQFARLFPYLKLEFFLLRHGAGESSTFEQKISDHEYFTDQLQTVTTGVFNFTPSISVAAFEQRLQNEHGIPVQVFRKSGKIWLETVQTDKLSLEQQNKLGREASNPIRFNINTLFL
jgi:hypothetical protein